MAWNQRPEQIRIGHFGYDPDLSRQVRVVSTPNKEEGEMHNTIKISMSPLMIKSKGISGSTGLDICAKSLIRMYKDSKINSNPIVLAGFVIFAAKTEHFPGKERAPIQTRELF